MSWRKSALPVALSANGTRELDRLGVLDPIVGLSTEPTELIYRDGRTGARIVAHPVRQGQAYRLRFGAPYCGIHRAALQRRPRARRIQRASWAASKALHLDEGPERNRRDPRLEAFPDWFGSIHSFDACDHGEVTSLASPQTEPQ